MKALRSAAAGEEEDFRSGMVEVAQTFGDRANAHDGDFLTLEFSFK